MPLPSLGPIPRPPLVAAKGNHNRIRVTSYNQEIEDSHAQ